MPIEIEARITTLEARMSALLVAPPRELTPAAMLEILARTEVVRGEATATLLPWERASKDTQHLWAAQRKAVVGPGVAYVTSNQAPYPTSGSGFHLDVCGLDGRWRTPLAAKDEAGALELADIVLRIAGLRLES